MIKTTIIQLCFISVLGLFLFGCSPKEVELSGINKTINSKIDSLFTSNEEEYVYINTEYKVSVFTENNVSHGMTYKETEIVQEKDKYYFSTVSSSNHLDDVLLVEERDSEFYTLSVEDFVYEEAMLSSLSNAKFKEYSDDYKNSFDMFYNDLQFEEVSESNYTRTFSKEELESSKIVQKLFELVEEENLFSGFSDIVVDYKFTDNTLELLILVHFDVDDDYFISGELVFKSVLSFSSTLEQPIINMDEYFLKSSVSVDKADSRFTFENEYNIALTEGDKNFYRFYFLPGTYRVITTNAFNDITLFDSNGTSLGTNEFVEVNETGYYYVMIDAEKEVKTELRILGSVFTNACNAEILECSSTVVIDEFDYIVIENSSNASNVDITLTDITDHGLEIYVNSIRYIIYKDETVHITISPDSNITLMVGSLISGYTEFTEIDYTISYELK